MIGVKPKAPETFAHKVETQVKAAVKAVETKTKAVEKDMIGDFGGPDHPRSTLHEPPPIGGGDGGYKIGRVSDGVIRELHKKDGSTTSFVKDFLLAPEPKTPPKNKDQKLGFVPSYAKTIHIASEAMKRAGVSWQQAIDSVKDDPKAPAALYFKYGGEMSKADKAHLFSLMATLAKDDIGAFDFCAYYTAKNPTNESFQTLIDTIGPERAFIALADYPKCREKFADYAGEKLFPKDERLTKEFCDRTKLSKADVVEFLVSKGNRAPAVIDFVNKAERTGEHTKDAKLLAGATYVAFDPHTKKNAFEQYTMDVTQLTGGNFTAKDMPRLNETVAAAKKALSPQDFQRFASHVAVMLQFTGSLQNAMPLALKLEPVEFRWQVIGEMYAQENTISSALNKNINTSGEGIDEATKKNLTIFSGTLDHPGVADHKAELMAGYVGLAKSDKRYADSLWKLASSAPNSKEGKIALDILRRSGVLEGYANRLLDNYAEADKPVLTALLADPGTRKTLFHHAFASSKREAQQSVLADVWLEGRKDVAKFFADNKPRFADDKRYGTIEGDGKFSKTLRASGISREDLLQWYATGEMPKSVRTYIDKAKSAEQKALASELQRFA